MAIYSGFYLPILFFCIGLFSFLVGLDIIPLHSTKEKKRKSMLSAGILLIVLSIIRTLFMI